MLKPAGELRPLPTPAGGKTMPDNVTEFLWWALNGTIATLLFYARSDLKEIKDSLKSNTAVTNNHEVRLTRLEVRCNIQHGEEDSHPMRRATDIMPAED